MNSSGQTPRAAQRAKRSLHKKFGDRKWFRGVGIVPVADGLALRLNIDASTGADDTIPKTYYNFPVEVIEIRAYETRFRSANTPE